MLDKRQRAERGVFDRGVRGMSAIDAIRLASSRARAHHKKFAVCDADPGFMVLTLAEARRGKHMILEVCGW